MANAFSVILTISAILYITVTAINYILNLKFCSFEDGIVLNL